MINNTHFEYLFIRACILFLDNILTVSLTYCSLVALSFIFPPLSRLCCLPLPIFAWLVVEVAFNFLIFRPRFRILQRDAVHPELPPRAEREKLFDRCERNIPDPEAYLSGWFGGASKNQIKRENVKEFLRWAFLDTREIREENEEEIEGYTKKTEEMLGRTLPKGWGNVKSLRLTLDEINFGHRSFCWYMCIAVVDTIASCRMWLQGFRFHQLPYSQFFRLFPFRPLTLLSRWESPVTHLSYWHRPHTSKTKLPVLFVHGIGIGLYPYTNFIRDIKQSLADNQDGEVGIIALELMPISFRITHAALSKDVMTAEIHAILKHHGWEKVVLVTHSYGSITATHLIKSPLTQRMIGPVVLIDPISFLLHLPDVAHNFTARKPVRANEHQLSYFGSQDTGVAHSLGRRFFWSENIIWSEDLGLGAPDGKRGVTVSLAGQDLIADTKTVARYLLSTPGESFRESSKANGHTNEHANGQANGHTNGHANGHANSHANGYANGHMNGFSKEGKPDAEKNAPIVTRRSDRTEGFWKSGEWEQSGLNLLWFEQLDHAQVFDKAKSRKVVAQVIKNYAMGS